jgi:hypothetical protein
VYGKTARKRLCKIAECPAATRRVLIALALLLTQQAVLKHDLEHALALDVLNASCLAYHAATSTLPSAGQPRGAQ